MRDVVRTQWKMREIVKWVVEREKEREKGTGRGKVLE